MIMPPLKAGEAGMVWILLLEGRWKMSTWWGQKKGLGSGRGEAGRGRKTHSFGAHGVWDCYEQLFGAFIM
jgi:hypothetical protein